jgi:hypothetical protein
LWVRSDAAATVIPRAAFDQPVWQDDERERARQSRWVVTVRSVLDGDDPLRWFHELVRLCCAFLPEAPAAYDPCSMTMLSATRLRRIAQSRVPPPPRTLYAIHAVPPERDAADPTCWIHTHGLARTQIPELDLVGVPPELIMAGATMIQMVVGVLVGRGVRDGAQEIEFGHECRVGFRSWQDVVRRLPRRANGGSRDRERSGSEHAGRRIVLGRFATRRTGEVWRTPLDLLQRVQRPGFTALRTTRETAREAERARESWPEFAMLFVRRRRPDWRFLAKIGIECPAEAGVPAEREHMWFEVEEIQKGRIRGVLLDEPLFVQGMPRGGSGWHDLAALSDWVIWTPLGAVTSQNADDGEIFARAEEDADPEPVG